MSCESSELRESEREFDLLAESGRAGGKNCEGVSIPGVRTFVQSVQLIVIVIVGSVSDILCVLVACV
jgi:hypothetical protein